MASDRGMLTANLINVLLDQEVQYFKSNPGRYLAGYDKQRDKFLYHSSNERSK